LFDVSFAKQILDLALELDLMVLIDVKELVQRNELADQITALVRERQMFDTTLVGSFDPRFLHRLRRREPRMTSILFTFPTNGLAALCENRYVIPKWTLAYSAACRLAPAIDGALDWFFAQRWLQQLVGASMVGQHWLAFRLEHESTSGGATPLLNRNYAGPAFAYVVNDGAVRARFLRHGIATMTDCVRGSCAEDILDPIVRRAQQRNDVF
jgi:hypothetical protein